MFLFELFDTEGGSMINDLRQRVMDYLTPLAAKEVEQVPMDHLKHLLSDQRSGLIVDRGLIMRLIEPDTNKLVAKVEGDTIFLQYPFDQQSAKTADQEERDKANMTKKAATQAKKDLT